MANIISKDTLVPITAVVGIAMFVSFATIQNQKLNQSAVDIATLKPVVGDVAEMKVTMAQLQRDVAAMNDHAETVRQAYAVLMALDEQASSAKPTVRKAPASPPAVPDGWALDKDGHPYKLNDL